jgi:hypothetical protein
MVATHCVGVDDPRALQALALSARELCQRTLVWQDVTQANVVAGVSEYSVDLPAQTDVARVLSATVSGSGMNLTPTHLVTEPKALVGGGDLGRPTCAYFQTATSIDVKLYPPPSESEVGGLVIKAAYAPLISATAIDDEVFAQYQETILHGALYRLMVTPEKSYSSPTQAMYFRGEFERGMSRASRDGLTGRVRAPLSVKPRSFI